jgi:polysaccharide biosynthesis/export protein
VAGRFFARMLFLFVVSGLTFSQANAQELPNLSPEQLQQLQQQQLQGRGPTAIPPSVTQQTTVLQPDAPQNPSLPSSNLETILSQRADSKLVQFGYDQLGVGRPVTQSLVGAVQDDYVLGAGDEIVVSLRGQENAEYRVTVDRDGRVVLPRMAPVAAGGRTFGEFRADLVNAIHSAYVATEGYISIGRLRQVSVLVSGEVNNPGIRTLTGLSKAVDAILISGGIKKSGSLRNVYILRGERRISVDLYSILTGEGRSSNVALADGDRIVVPPLGATVAIAGTVRRPAIYELPPYQTNISLRNLMALASGETVPGVYTVSVLRLMPDGKRQFVDVTKQPETLVHDGEIVILKAAVDVSIGRVTMDGAVRTPGAFALDKYPTLHDLLSSADVLKPGAYVLFGFIVRLDHKTMQREALPFSPLHVIKGSENRTLMSDDVVHVLTEDDVQALLGLVPQEKPQQPQQPPTQQGGQIPQQSEQTPQQSEQTPQRSPLCPQGVAPGTAACAANGAVGNTSAFAVTTANDQTAMQASILGVTNGTAGQANTAAPAAMGEQAGTTTAESAVISSADVALFGNALTDYKATFSGAVHKAGTFLIAPDTTLDEALTAAHGLSNDADLSSFEMTSTLIDNATGTATTDRKTYPASADEFARIVLKPFDSIEFHHVYSDKAEGTIHLAGEVRYPGNYTILREERLSSVLARAGGLTSIAYPYGTVFLRQSVAQTEQEGYRRAAAEIRSQLISVVTRPVTSTTNAQPLTADTITAIEGLLNQVESNPALGRISIVADPAVLATQPRLDPILEPGDSITIPKRPSTVSVLGEVMQPGSILFNPSMTVSDYVRRSGGYTQFADKSRVVVVLPDGTARVSQSSSWLSFDEEGEIPPGSTIVVARDLEQFSGHQLILDFTQIFTQLATAAAALAVLSEQH